MSKEDRMPDSVRQDAGSGNAARAAEDAWFLGLEHGRAGTRPQDGLTPFPGASARYAYLSLDAAGRERLAGRIGLPAGASRDLADDYFLARDLASGDWELAGPAGIRPGFLPGRRAVTVSGREGVLTGEAHPAGHPLARFGASDPVPVRRGLISGPVVHVYESPGDAWEHARLTWFQLADGDVIWVPAAGIAGVMWDGAPAEPGSSLAEAGGDACREGIRLARELMGSRRVPGAGGTWAELAGREHRDYPWFRPDPSGSLTGEPGEGLAADGGEGLPEWQPEDDEAERQRAAFGLDAAGQPLTRCAVPAVLRPAPWAWQESAGTLLHVIPLQDAASGESRRHPAGTALCEEPGRAVPLSLGDPVGEAALSEMPRCRDCTALEEAARPASGAAWPLGFPVPVRPARTAGRTAAGPRPVPGTAAARPDPRDRGTRGPGSPR
jgi:hypothetical protein